MSDEGPDDRYRDFREGRMMLRVKKGTTGSAKEESRKRWEEYWRKKESEGGEDNNGM